MKKILIALMALAGVAAAETIVFDFGRTDEAAYKTSGAIVIGSGKDPYKTAITSSGTLGSITGSYTYTQADSGGYSSTYSNSATLATTEENGRWKNHLTAMPTGWESTFADGLTSQWNGSTGNTHTLTLTKLAGGYYDFSILGGYYGDDVLCSSITLTISGTGVDMSNTTWATYDIAGAQGSSTQGVATFKTTLTNGSADEGYTYDVSTIYVAEGASLTLTLTGDTVNGHRTPLNGLKMTYTVPEPTTATLSLLALAGLATRRRRRQA